MTNKLKKSVRCVATDVNTFVKKIQAFLTSGCSFSEHFDQYSTERCWPGHLQKYFPYAPMKVNTGMGSTGNELIARKGIFMCNQALHQYPGDEILLILMWSGLARKAFLTDNLHNVFKASYFRSMHSGLGYPQRQGTNYLNQALDTNDPSWIWFNPGWVNDPGVETWYTQYDNDYQQFDTTLWNMLQVQNFCIMHNINYYWMTMNNEFDSFIEMYGNEFYAQYLLDNLDMSNRITPQGQYEWNKSNHADKFLPDNFHPTSEAHKLFTDSIIVPFLADRGILNV